VLAAPAPAPSVQFEGLANSDNVSVTGFSVLPPDHNLGVGPSHIFQMVNIVGRITDKSGGASSTFSLRNFFAVDPGFGESDPRVIYDAASGRWFALQVEFTSSSSSVILVVSATSDPTGAFCRYRLGNPTSEAFLQDYPMLGVSDDKVVVSYNGFSLPAENFIGAGYYVVNKANLTACAASVSMNRVAPNMSRFTPHPAQSLGSTSNLHMPMHVATNTLTLLTVSGVPGVSVVTETSTALPIRSWTDPPAAPQLGSGVLLDTGDDRVLSVAWQNNALWVAGAEACTPTGDSGARSCLRMIEVRTDTSTVRQDMTFGTVGEYYSYPALRPDGAGNLLVVFTRSSPSVFAGVRATGRLATDPLNTLGPSSELRAGGGAQTHSSGRMGDYSGAATDPSDPSAVWVMGEYIRATGTANWGTYIAKLRLTSVVSRIKTFTLPPCRVLDTRLSNPPGPILANGTRSILVAGDLTGGRTVNQGGAPNCGVPDTATGVFINVAAVNAGGPGHLTVYPFNTSLPLASTLNFTTGQTIANGVLVPTCTPAGSCAFDLNITMGPAGAHVVIDVTGYLLPTP
jgi:hypothetical protein